jgi:hypothetical protein
MADASAATCTIGHIGWDRSNVPHAGLRKVDVDQQSVIIEKSNANA